MTGAAETVLKRSDSEKALPPVSRLAGLKPWRKADLPADEHSRSFKLLKYFSLSSALAFLVTGGLFVGVHGWHQQKAIQEMSRDRNVALVQILAKTIWLNHAEYLSSAGHLTGDALRARAETTLLDREIRTVLVGLPVLKVKIYHGNANTVFSTEAAQMGHKASLHTADFEKIVSTGQPKSKISFRESFNGVDGTANNVYVTETYVPIHDSFGGVAAVFEIYADMTGEMHGLQRNTREVATLVLCMFTLLYGVLFLLVRRAEKTLVQQQYTLKTLNRRLEVESAKTTSLNAALEEKVLQLERSNQDLQDFAHVASHDLQEPLRKIETFGSRLSQRYGTTLPEDGRMFIERMQDASSRMRKLISDLLTYSRSVTMQAPAEPVNLAAVLDNVLSDLQVRIEETGAKIRIGTLHRIEADPVQMHQLLQNLVANGLKFRKKDVAPVITIDTSLRCSSPNERLDQLVLTVSDNGVGFDPNLAHRLFKVFHRLHGRSEFEGTGIGLATCRKIVERHGGTIEAAGSIGQGARFTVVLPLVQNKRSLAFGKASGSELPA